MKNQTLLVALFTVLTFTACSTVDPGFEGHKYNPYGDGMDGSHTYSEGVHWTGMFSDMITYDMREQSESYNSEVLDKNGLEVQIQASLNFRIKQGMSDELHLQYGGSYIQSFVDPIAKGAIKDVAGKYTAEELYSSKRENLEQEIEDILTIAFENTNLLQLSFVEISDVDLPSIISKAIEAKEAQEQQNLLSEKKRIQAVNEANALVETARGDSLARVINAAGEASAIKIQQRELSPQYIEFVKWSKWNGTLPTTVAGGNGVLLNIK